MHKGFSSVFVVRLYDDIVISIGYVSLIQQQYAV